MSTKFYPGQADYIAQLNAMDDAFAAGPYGALPLTGGTLTGTFGAPSVSTRLLTVGSEGLSRARNYINRGDAPGNEILYIGQDGVTAPSLAVLAADGAGGWAGVTSVLFIGKNNLTSRSISSAGTINASGADYAEYMGKSAGCGTVMAGQIVGIDVDGHLTDCWARSVAFAVKSTAPCMVGGDSWTQTLGGRPSAPQREAADTDDAWAAKESAHTAALDAFDAELEQLRQTVDRIAFAGQVPVNALGATPGQYMVPVQDGDGIAGAAMYLADMAMAQYAAAVGKVIAIEPDGRARIIVKVA